MVKGVTTSIITVALLMGSLIACGDSSDEIAELRTEIPDTRKR